MKICEPGGQGIILPIFGEAEQAVGKSVGGLVVSRGSLQKVGMKPKFFHHISIYILHNVILLPSTVIDGITTPVTKVK